jgi:iron complex outermembrane receptor protein
LAFWLSVVTPAGAQETRPVETGADDEVLEPSADGDLLGEEGAAEGEPRMGIEEILIQGVASETVAQDEPISAVDFDESDLLDLGIQDIRDLATFTPNLEIKTAFAAVNPTLFIRGVGLDDFNANSASAVSVYQDGVYMYSPAGQLFGLYDVQSIDVLRGPQPTLTNASAGAIVVRSRRPTEGFEAYLTSTLGTPARNGVAAGYNERTFQGALNVPIVPEWLLARGSFKVRTRDGITENACGPRIRQASVITDPVERLDVLGDCFSVTGESQFGAVTPPTSLVDLVNNIDNWAARGLLSVRMPFIGEDVDWLLNVNGGQNNSLATQYQHTGLSVSNPDPATGEAGPQFSRDPNGNPIIDRSLYRENFTEGDNFAGEYDRIGPETLDLFGASLTGTWPATSSLEVESLTAYVFHDRKTFANDDANPKIWLDSDYKDRSNAVNQELTLRWLLGQDADATLGGTFIWEELTGNNVFRNRRVPIPPDGFFAFDQDFRQETIQWGLYGATRFSPAEIDALEALRDFELAGSLRYNWVQKDFSQASIGIRGTGGVQFPANVGGEQDVWDALGGDVSLTYYLQEDKSVYAKYTVGWKAGHFNLGTLTSGVPLTPVAPETVESIEVGLRTQWLDGLLQANLTAFWYDYQDLQVFQTTVDARGNIFRRLINAESAKVQGVELDLFAEPVEGLSLSFNGAYLDSEYDKFGTSFQRNRRVPGANPPIQTIFVNQDYSGNPLIASPRWSFNAKVSYDLVMGRYGTLRPWYAVAYKDEFFFDANDGFGAEGTLVERLLREPAYWLHNAGISYTTPNGRWEIGFWIRNFLNEEYRIQSFDLGIPNRLILDVYGDPRTAGITFTVRFD